jgi:hypothetical protein
VPQDPKTAALVDHILAVAGVAAPAAR